MSAVGDSPDDLQARAHPDSDATRLAALELQVAALSAEVAAMRGSARRVPPREAARPSVPSQSLLDALRHGPGSEGPSGSNASSFADRARAGATISGDEIESLVGRYGTLGLAGLVILMAVGAVIKMAVEQGLLTPAVRIGAGVLVAIALAAAGVYFRQRGEIRYGGVLLALSLAVVDLVAWGAGPHFQLVPSSIALGAVDLSAIALAALALRDGSEFLFSVAVAGALSAPFVTSDGGGTALSLLWYGGTVLAGALRSVRDPSWMRAFALLVAGALVYALAAAALPMNDAWHGPFLVALFGGACAVAVMLLGETEWKSDLSRAYLAAAVVGVISGWDAIGPRPFAMTMSIAVGLAAVTHFALLLRDIPTRFWAASAVLLPGVSLGVAYAGAAGARTEGAVIATWCMFGLLAWRTESGRGEGSRAGAHLLGAAILGCFAISAWLWPQPLPFVAALAAWGALLSWLGRNEASPLPLVGMILACGAAALFAVDQLASRAAYQYLPFATRSSASAGAAAAGLYLAGLAIGGGSGIASVLADRPLRLGALIGFVILWGRMEVANAFSPDLSVFLLTSYYAACGVGSIVAGRHFGAGWLRVAGLALAIVAGLKGLLEVTEIDSVLLRVSAYGAVGVFLLGAGYLYRERK